MSFYKVWFTLLGLVHFSLGAWAVMHGVSGVIVFCVPGVLLSILGWSLSKRLL